MRLLPCPSAQCRAHGALLPPSEAFPHGEPYLSAQYVGEYRCDRCGAMVKITPADFFRAKTLTTADYERLASVHGAPALKELPVRDLVALGFKAKQAAQLHDFGIRTAQDVDAEARKA